MGEVKMKTNRGKQKPVPLQEGAHIETVDEFLARGGKILKCPEAEAQGIWKVTQF